MSFPAWWLSWADSGPGKFLRVLCTAEPEGWEGGSGRTACSVVCADSPQCSFVHVITWVLFGGHHAVQPGGGHGNPLQ